MGQKINPISNRLGIIRGWDSNWFGGKNFGDTLLEDTKIRKYLNARLANASVSRIVIERTWKLTTITICASHPGVIIGKGGQEVDKLKEELKKITDKEVQINIFEVRKPELDAQIVGKSIARQIEGMVAYRRAIKMAIANAMRMGAEGIKVLVSSIDKVDGVVFSAGINDKYLLKFIRRENAESMFNINVFAPILLCKEMVKGKKIQISGRLNGAEMARKEMYKEGRTPLHTFRADIDYCQTEALTKVGLLGIKVWICRGEIYGKKDLAPNFVQSNEKSRNFGNSSRGRGDRNGRRRKNANR